MTQSRSLIFDLDRKSTRLNSSPRCIHSLPTRRSSDLRYLRDRHGRAVHVAGDPQCVSGPANQSREFLVGDLVDLAARLNDDELRAVLGRVVEARDDAVAIADFRFRSEEHTSELQSPMYPLSPYTTLFRSPLPS